MTRTYSDFMLQQSGAGAQGFIQNVLNAQDSIARPATTAGTAYDSALILSKSIEALGNRLYRTQILLDMTGLDSVNTAADVIGKSTSPAHFHRYLTEESGTCIAAYLHCFEAPATGDADVDICASTAATGVLSDASAGLAGYAKLLDGATLAANDVLSFTALPANNDYLYLASGTGAAGTYTAGIVQMTFIGRI